MSLALLNSREVKAQALRLGFVACGLAKAEPVAEPVAAHYRQWLELGYCADMDYLRRNVEMRMQPDLLVPGVKTIVSLAMNFMPARHQPAISLYAQGKDYHDVMRSRMRQLMEDLGLEGRVFVDTAPVLERYWAWRSGIGIITQSGGFISVPGYGPTVFLGELFLTSEADYYGSPLPAHHGSPLPASPMGECLNLAGQGSFGGNGALPQRGSGEGALKRTICPALTAEGLDARRCISYQTIEHRGAFPTGFRLWPTFYGCDRCLRANPQFAEAHPTDEPAFQPSEDLLNMTPDDWAHLTEEQYQRLFKGSAVKRAKYAGLMRNICCWLSS